MKTQKINNQLRLLFENESLDRFQSKKGVVYGIRCYTNPIAIFFLTLFGRAIYDNENKVHISTYSFKNWLQQHKKKSIIKSLDINQSIPAIVLSCKKKLEQKNIDKALRETETDEKTIEFPCDPEQEIAILKRINRNNKKIGKIKTDSFQDTTKQIKLKQKNIFDTIYKSTRNDINMFFRTIKQIKKEKIQNLTTNDIEKINAMKKKIKKKAMLIRKNNMSSHLFLSQDSINRMEEQYLELQKLAKNPQDTKPSKNLLKVLENTHSTPTENLSNKIKNYAEPYSESNKNGSQISRLFLKYLEIFDCQNNLQSFTFDENTGNFTLQLKNQSKYWYQPKKEIQKLQKGIILEFGDVNGKVSGTYDKIKNKIIFTKGFNAFTEYTTGLPWPLPKTIDANATLNEIGLNEDDHSKFSATSTPQTPLSMFNKPLSKKVSIHQFFEELETGKKVIINNKEFFENL